MKAKDRLELNEWLYAASEVGGLNAGKAADSLCVPKKDVVSALKDMGAEYDAGTKLWNPGKQAVESTSPVDEGEGPKGVVDGGSLDDSTGSLDEPASTGSYEPHLQAKIDLEASRSSHVEYLQAENARMQAQLEGFVLVRELDAILGALDDTPDCGMDLRAILVDRATELVLGRVA